MIPGRIIERATGMIGGALPYLVFAVAIFGLVYWIDHRGYSRAEAKYTAEITKLQDKIRTKTAEALAEDLAHARVIEQAQAAISQEVSHDYQARIADVRARYERLLAQAKADPGRRRPADLPGLPTAIGGSDAAPPENRLPPADALIATEQAIQLDSLITEIERQAAIAR